MGISRRTVMAAGNSNQSGTGWGSGNTIAIPFFEETFANGQLNPYGGFVYSNDRGSINGLTVVAAGSPGAQVMDGYTHSLQGTYAGKALGLQNGSPQLNFSFGREVNELWFEWVFHIPTNYFHRNNYVPEPFTGVADNNKFWLFWAGAYSSGYHQTSCELFPSVTSGSTVSDGKSYARPTMRWSTDGVVKDLYPNYNPLIGAGELCVPGTWNTMRCHTRKSSALGVADGLWRQWINGTLTNEYTGLTMGASDPEKFSAGLSQGYLLGYANSGFTEDTVIHTQVLRAFSTNPGW